MAIFQSSVLKKFLKQQDDAAVAKAYKKFTKYFHNPKIQENIREIKEEGFQQKFLMELFVTVFNYTINPDPKYNLTTEYKNLKGAKKADGAVLQDGKALAVIELKSTKTKDLESIRQQAFDYKANQPGCVYVITSNFEKLRFYINKSYEFEEFDLFNLSEDEFKLMYLCLQKDNLLKNVPLKIKEASILEEEAITKKFYADYSLFKRELYRDLVKRNMRNDVFRNVLAAEESVSKADKNIKLTLFKKSQKLLDRFLFLFFGEDRGLLPPNSVPKILEQWEKLKELDEYVPLYDRYKKYFNYLNEGWKGKDYEIFAYNGGLFKPDAILDSIVIDDDLLFRHTSILTKYDFESQVDVNILGHIFENSLNEIESVNAEIEGVEFDKQKTKRKKDGVFYTPKYITKYIVDNTIGRLCEERKVELGIKEEEYFKGRRNRPKAIVSGLLEAIIEYREWLLDITICDPACGSGAFLNEALNFLISEHNYVAELESKLMASGQQTALGQDVETQILENNIYGVDLNEESVEIAKLSLWLRSAQKGRKLTSLNNNIKCGNSLIDSRSLAGEKAFNWEEEFPEVFTKGGFDVIIGNPPYGAKLKKDDLDYIVSKYSYGGLTRKLSDTYIAFYIVCVSSLLKLKGVLGFITPNTWRLIASGDHFRKYMFLDDHYIYEMVQHNEKVFADATVDCDTVFIEKSNPSGANCQLIIKDRETELLKHHVSITQLKKQEFINLGLSDLHYKLKEKIESKGMPVSDLFEIKNGIKPYEKGKGKPPQTAETMKEKPFTSENKMSEYSKPLIGGSSFNRYQLLWNNDNWVEYGEWLAAPRDSAIFEEKEKLIFRQTSDSIRGTKISCGFIMRNNTHVLLKSSNRITLNYALGVLNSSLTDFYYWTINPERGEAMAEVKAFHLGMLRLPIAENEIQEQVSKKVEHLLGIHEATNSRVNKFTTYLQSQYSGIVITSRLKSWFDLEFGEFIKELNKVIKKAGGEKLSKADEMEWMDLFEAKKKEAMELKAQIDQTDREIDQMVYELYGLSEEEIEIVENS